MHKTNDTPFMPELNPQTEDEERDICKVHLHRAENDSFQNLAPLFPRALLCSNPTNPEKSHDSLILFEFSISRPFFSVENRQLLSQLSHSAFATFSCLDRKSKANGYFSEPCIAEHP